MNTFIKYIAGVAMISLLFAEGVFAQTLPTDSTVWLRADVGVTTVDGKVTSWADQSGHGYNATQSTEIWQPSLITDGINGLPVIRFNDTHLLSTENISLTSTDFSVFIVAKVNSAADAYQYLLTYTDSPGKVTPVVDGGFFLYNGGNAGAGASLRMVRPGISDRSVTVENWMGGNTPKIGEFDFSSTANSFLAVNGEKVGETASPFGTTLQIEKLHIGAEWGYNTESGQPRLGLRGDIAEILIYDRALTEAERYQVLNYLGDRYGIAVVPEPSIVGLLAITGALALLKRRRTRTSSGI